MGQPFALTEADARPGCRIVQVAGELDLAVADHLREVLNRAAADGMNVMIDLGDCEFIDSTGIGVIVLAYREALADGRRLAVHGGSSQVQRVLSVTGLKGNGLAFDGLGEALERVVTSRVAKPAT